MFDLKTRVFAAGHRQQGRRLGLAGGGREHVPDIAKESGLLFVLGLLAAFLEDFVFGGLLFLSSVRTNQIVYLGVT